MNRGDVVLVQLPPPAGPSGTEQFGTRPAIVVQDEAGLANLSTLLIVPLTSRLSPHHESGRHQFRTWSHHQTDKGGTE
jgi:mRNA-degrading endonuclease toxin of MazEF toxin-antitoxin module